LLLPASFGSLFTFRLTKPEDLDGELVALLREAYAVGCQEHI
jgi:hypothetical protein